MGGKGSTKRPLRPQTTQRRKGGRCSGDGFRQDGSARNQREGAAEPTRAAVCADPKSHGGILPDVAIAAEDLSSRASACSVCGIPADGRDRKSTRLNSSHSQISYAVFCLKKKKK